MRYVYMDNAATTRTSKAAIEAMLPFYREFYANPSSLHTSGQRAKELLEEARARLAVLLGVEPREVYFTSGGSEADNQAIRSLAYAGKRKGKTHVISAATEHHAVLHALERLKEEGFDVEILPVDGDGRVSSSAVAAAIRQNTAFVTIMYANNEIGTINPIRGISEVCKKNGVYFHTDAVQAVGHIPVNAKTDGFDALSLSAHKFHGPKGVGALYVRKGIPLRPLIEGGAQERGMRAGTENTPAIFGMVVALEEAIKGMAATQAKLERLRNRLIDGLLSIEHTVLNGSRTNRLPSNVNVIFEGIEGESLLLMLDEKGICASSGSACTSGSLDPSHVLLAIGRPHEIAHGSLRLTLSDEATDDDVDYVLKNLPPIVGRLREMSSLWQDKLRGVKNFVL